MFNEMKTKVTYAVKEVYHETDTNSRNGAASNVGFLLRVPGILGDHYAPVEISRSTMKDDLYYKLYTKDFGPGSPFLTVFGCWPQEFVVDVFCKALAHYYDIKEEG